MEKQYHTDHGIYIVKINMSNRSDSGYTVKHQDGTHARPWIQAAINFMADYAIDNLVFDGFPISRIK